MGRKFEIPSFYRSSIISTVKNARRTQDHRKKDLTPSILDFGGVRFKIARHFGFCFGVENAIEIAFRALEENPDKRIYLLSEMIHNPTVNRDLIDRGVRFILSPDGTQLIPFEELRPEDIVIVPAFGTTVELFEKLKGIGINPEIYNATCPFVEKVWNRSSQLGGQGFTVIIHGKHYHEETRATFSHARLSTASMVIRDMGEAKELARFIRNEGDVSEFMKMFSGRLSEGFDPTIDLHRIGVVNQTTMLAYETQEISDFLRSVMEKTYGAEALGEHFADTRDTLCYATAENQNAIHHLVETGGDLAIVVGGYNSSNTSHLAKICKKSLPTYYVQDAEEILSHEEIRHMDLDSMTVVTSSGWLPKKQGAVEILMSAGASSPDALVDQVILRLVDLLGVTGRVKEALKPFADVSGSETPLVNLP